MEKPYKVRSTVTETIHGLTIEIPTKRNWMGLAFLSFWLCGWFGGELFALFMVLSAINKGVWGPELFILFWLLAWTAAGFVVIRIWLSMIAGKEIINFNRGILTVRTRFKFFSPTNTFHIKKITQFGLNNNEVMTTKHFGNRTLQLKSSGALSFMYENTPQGFAQGLVKSEADMLFEKIKDRRFFKEEQYKVEG